MPQIKIYNITQGGKKLISSKEVTQDVCDKINEKFAKMKADAHERMQKRFDEMPEIYWDILGYANTHSKEECLREYPEQKEFIDSIVFNK